MSVILVLQIPNGWSFKHLAENFAPVVPGGFRVLKFGAPTKRGKSAFIELDDGLSPRDVLSRIKNYRIGDIAFDGFIPKPHVVKKAVGHMIKTVDKKTGAVQTPFHKTFFIAILEIMQELEIKYSSLMELVAKTDCELLHKIAGVIFERLSKVVVTADQASQNSFQLTRCYRRVHPHFADFQMILSNLHELEDAQGKPRTQISESELKVVPPKVTVPNATPEDIDSAINRYTNIISAKLQEHLKSLDTEITGDEDDETSARKRVRSELKKMDIYVNVIVNQIIRRNFDKFKPLKCKFAMYGEPHLPPREQTMGLLKKLQAIETTRSKTMYNLLVFVVPVPQYQAAMKLEGSIINGATLTIRPLRRPAYRMKPELKEAIHERCSEIAGQLNL